MTDGSNEEIVQSQGNSGNFISNMKVKTKIFTGFGLVLAILAFMAGNAYRELVVINQDFVHYVEVAADTQLVVSVDRNFTDMRRNVMLYAERGDAQYSEQVQQLGKKVIDDLDVILSHITREEDIKLLQHAQQELRDYLENFKDITRLRGLVGSYDEGLIKSVSDAGRGIEDRIKAIVDNDLVAHILTLRRIENEFMQRHDEALIEEFDVAVAALGRAAADLPFETGREINAMLKTYQTDFHELAKDYMGIDLLINDTMYKEAVAIGGDMTEFLEHERKELKKTEDLTIAEIVTAEEHAVIAAVIGFVLGLIVAFVIARSIVKPVTGMTDAMGRLAGGDLEADIPAQGRQDEIGLMAAAVQVFKDNAIRNKEMAAEAEEQKRRAEEEKRQLMLKMADDFETSVGGVVQSVSSASTEMQSSATALSATAEQTSKQATTVAGASEEAATYVQTVASAAEELSSSVSEISRQVAQSTQIAGAAVAEVNGANEKVQGLADAAKKIGEVVALITDIADQTNLLALNATIEAARAGEAGKGFAVVASEVKNLASATAKATEEISSQIGGIQTATGEAVAAIGSIGGTIAQMNEIASTIAAAVEEQGAATQEIARNVEQAAQGTQEVSSNISGVQEASNETGKSAEQMLDAANELSQQSETLKIEVDKFLANIRNG